MSDSDFDSSFGIDPRQKSNIRKNSDNIPTGIDWDALMNIALSGPSGPDQTPLGFINDQEGHGKKAQWAGPAEFDEFKNPGNSQTPFSPNSEDYSRGFADARQGARISDRDKLSVEYRQGYAAGRGR